MYYRGCKTERNEADSIFKSLPHFAYIHFSYTVTLYHRIIIGVKIPCFITNGKVNFNGIPPLIEVVDLSINFHENYCQTNPYPFPFLHTGTSLADVSMYRTYF